MYPAICRCDDQAFDDISEESEEKKKLYHWEIIAACSISRHCWGSFHDTFLGFKVPHLTLRPEITEDLNVMGQHIALHQQSQWTTAQSASMHDCRRQGVVKVEHVQLLQRASTRLKSLLMTVVNRRTPHNSQRLSQTKLSLTVLLHCMC